jgi:hypothetical protein
MLEGCTSWWWLAMCCAQSYFHQINLFHVYSNQTLYFYSLTQWFILKIKKIPLSSICMVSNLLIIFPTLLRMLAYQFRIHRVEEHMFQTIDHRKVSHHQCRNISLLVVLLVGIIFIINTRRTDSSILLILFLHSVNIHMIVTSLVSTHTTYPTLRFELMLFTVQNTMIGMCMYFVHT